MSGDFELENYLNRIGFYDTARPDLATLKSIHAAHADAIPFEGLDPFLRRPVKLDLASLQEKLVRSRRGGYCFEQNTLLKGALEAIGFKVTGLGGRVRWMSPPDSPIGPRTHMLLKVDLAEGTYLADAGFGACVLDAPLRLETCAPQQTAMGAFCLSESGDMYLLSAKQAAGWRAMYMFNLEPQFPSDFDLGNWYTSTNPVAPFLSTLIAERVSGTARYKLNNRTFSTETAGGYAAEVRMINSPSELYQVLDGTFNITPPAPIEEIFARTGEQAVPG